MHSGAKGIAIIDSTLDTVDNGFDFVDEKILGRPPEEQKKNTMFEFEMWGDEYIKKLVELAPITKKKKSKKGKG